MSEKNKYIECAKIINTHGCRGGLKLEAWCNTPEDLASLKRVFLLDRGVYTEHRVIKASVFKQFVLVEISDIDDMDSAIALKNKILYADRQDFELEDGEYFITDLIGIKVIDTDNGKVYGTVSDIINRGASDIYVINTENGERMIPAVDEFIIKTDINEGIFVKVIPGLLD